MIRRKPRQRVLQLSCFFCDEKSDPDYKDPETLRKFITSRGRITPRTKNGLCQKHQRRLKISIKRARYLSLLPFLKQV